MLSFTKTLFSLSLLSLSSQVASAHTVSGTNVAIDASVEEVVLQNKGLTSVTFKNVDRARIRVLWLDRNKLASLPAVIGSLTALTELHLNDNQLTSLPAEIGNLTALMYLYLGVN
jgi:leucine-rich repeat protein SHOC2